MDLYRRLGNELRSLFVDLFNPTHSLSVTEKMTKIVATASQIGGPIEAEAERLNTDVLRFLQSRHDPKLIAVMKEHALKLERETREI